MATTPDRDERPTVAQRAAKVARPRVLFGLVLPLAAALAATAPEPAGAAAAGLIALGAFLAGREAR